MSRVQSRKSISLNGEVYRRLKEHCTEQEVTMAGVVEDLLEKFLPPERLVPPLPTIDPDSGMAKRREMIKESAKKDPKVEAALAFKGREIKNPCRKERCGIEQVHETHD